ncbi:MAG TPA: flagellar protein FlaG [Nitrosospira sp.]|jgi:flagellar protein FlaG|nr:flagellar protein FlaG [Nitrosospira sp.]
MRIEPAGKENENHIGNQTGTAAGVPVSLQPLQAGSARVDGKPAAVSIPEAALPVMGICIPIRPRNRVMEFTIDPDSGKQVVRIMDCTSNELVRQIPMEEVLARAKSLDQLKELLHAKA